jgi:hypothetical protein
LPDGKCTRCKKLGKIERHHIIYRSRGGSNDASNLVNLCQACHKYRHVKEKIEAQIKRKENRIKKNKKNLEYHERRLVLLKYRLKVVDKLNTIRNIKKYGYRSYWKDPKTH